MLRILVCGLLFVAAPLWAERVEPRFELGATSYADDGAQTHLALGGSVRAYLTRRWSVDPEFLYLRHNSGTVRDRDYLLWGNFALDLRNRTRAVVPYWFAGPGIINHRSRFASQGFSSTEAAFGTGLGVKFVSGRVFVAPQFRIGAADGFFAELSGSIGFVWKK